MSQNGNQSFEKSPLLDLALASKIALQLFELYSRFPSPEAITGYMKGLAGKITEDEAERAVVECSRLYISCPKVSQIIAMVMEWRDEAASHGVLKEMQGWEPSDPEWPELVEFRTLMEKVLDDMNEYPPKRYAPVERIDFAPFQASLGNQINKWALDQSLKDDLPRTKPEVEVIKQAHKRHREGKI